MNDAQHLEQVASPLVTSPLAHALGKEFGAFRALGLTVRMWIRNFVPFTLVVVALCVPAILWILKAEPSEVRTVGDFVYVYLLWPLCVTVGLSTLLAPLLMYRVIRQLEGTWAPLATSMQVGLRGVPPVLIMAGVSCVMSLIPLGWIAGAVSMCVWFVVTPSAVAEALGPFAAFRRSAELTRGRRWNILRFHLLVGGVLVVCFLVWIFFAIDSLHGEAASFKRPSILCVIGASVFYTFRGLTEAVGYVLLRREKEGVSGYVDPARVATAIVLPPRRPANRHPGNAST